MNQYIEIWKDIPDYENFYQASNLGRIKSLSRIDASGHLRKEKMIKLCIDSYGYYNTHLYKNTIAKNMKVHRAIALAFIPNPECKPQIHHKNFNKLDNNIENLEWVDSKTNINYSHKMGKVNVVMGERHYAAKFDDNQIRNIREVYSHGNISPKELAKKFNVGGSNIYFIINKKTWKHVK